MARFPMLHRCTVMALLLTALQVEAQSPAPAASDAPVPEFVQTTQRWLDDAVAKAPPVGNTALRMEVSVGSLDSRLRLAPCAKVEPYLPPGGRLWGKTRLGLRCLEGTTRWNVFLPITVKAFGPAWVARGPVQQGAVLTMDDAMEAEADWADDSSPVVADPSLWLGQIAARNWTPGQAIRHSMVKPATVFQAGTQVRVVAQGTGFQVMSDGQALSAGVVGQPARVRMENGRIMSGVVLDARTVRLEL